jgi:hypothetical protein
MSQDEVPTVGPGGAETRADGDGVADGAAVTPAGLQEAREETRTFLLRLLLARRLLEQASLSIIDPRSTTEVNGVTGGFVMPGCRTYLAGPAGGSSMRVQEM